MTPRSLALFAIGAVTGAAIWIPTQALQPRYSYGAAENNGPNGWYIAAMIIAPIVLGVAFRDRWKLAAPSLVLPQLLLAPTTAPRGDGLWILIFPMLIVYLGVAHVLAYAGSTTRHARSASARR